MSRKEYIKSFRPCLVGLPHTALRYDALMQPTIVPFHVACLKMKDICRCYSQQATSIRISSIECENIVENGIFIDFPLNHDAKRDEHRDALANQKVPFSSN